MYRTVLILYCQYLLSCSKDWNCLISNDSLLFSGALSVNPELSIKHCHLSCIDDLIACISSFVSASPSVNSSCLPTISLAASFASISSLSFPLKSSQSGIQWIFKLVLSFSSCDINLLMFNIIMSTLYLGIPIQDAETIADWLQQINECSYF